MFHNGRKKEKVALRKDYFFNNQCFMLDRIRPFPSRLYPCSKAYLRASEHGGTSELRL